MQEFPQFLDMFSLCSLYYCQIKFETFRQQILFQNSHKVIVGVNTLGIMGLIPPPPPTTHTHWKQHRSSLSLLGEPWSDLAPSADPRSSCGSRARSYMLVYTLACMCTLTRSSFRPFVAFWPACGSTADGEGSGQAGGAAPLIKGVVLEGLWPSRSKETKQDIKTDKKMIQPFKHEQITCWWSNEVS